MRKSGSVTFKRVHTGILSLLLAFAISGTAAATAAGANQQAPSPNSSDYQAWLANQVRHQLVMLPYYSVFDNLEYRIEGRHVTLMGQVVWPTLKEDAAKAVKHIEGVQSVDNQIQVLPIDPMDEQIRRAEFRAIYDFPGMDIYVIRSVQPIHIIVDNGHVTLEGVVRNQTDKNIAGLAANRVPNVFSVTNNLRVENS
jgi:hyperosmotically inducible periplasmic protein